MPINFRVIFASTLILTSQFVSANDEPKCHLYIYKSGWVVSDIDSYIGTSYSSSNICETTFSGYPCYSYFVSKKECTTDDKSLVELFKKDMRAAGQLIE
jgi:hypothetical protein